MTKMENGEVVSTTIGINRLILCSPCDPIELSFHMADCYVEIIYPWLQSEKTFEQFEGPMEDEHFLVIRQIDIDKVEQSSLAEEPLISLHPESESAYKSAPYTLWAYIAKGLMVSPRRRVCLVEGPGDTDSFRKVQGLLAHHQPASLEGLELTFHREISAESPII